MTCDEFKANFIKLAKEHKLDIFTTDLAADIAWQAFNRTMIANEEMIAQQDQDFFAE